MKTFYFLSYNQGKCIGSLTLHSDCQMHAIQKANKFTSISINNGNPVTYKLYSIDGVKVNPFNKFWYDLWTKFKLFK